MVSCNAGNIEINNIKFKHCVLNSSGSGNVILKNSAFNTLDIRLFSSGNVLYNNIFIKNPILDITGSGSVINDSEIDILEEVTKQKQRRSFVSLTILGVFIIAVIVLIKYLII